MAPTFTDRLWYLANHDKYQFIQWTPTQSRIIVFLDELQVYLHSRVSLFQFDTLKSFLLRLAFIGFKEVHYITDNPFRMEFTFPQYTRRPGWMPSFFDSSDDDMGDMEF